ncbi:MAG: DUF3598 family protein [Leptolyngbya sp. SIO3F4]|nr:DUF3598 family protein [Leptolyngbya sp. SIO3F4]
MSQFSETDLETLWSTAQWSYIRKNIGEWRGSFIQFSPEAIWVSETPSVLTLEEDCPDQHMTLVLERTPQGKPINRMERDLGYPGAAPYICFFPTGGFSQGAMQRRPWSSFGSEFSLLADNRRMRLVQLYKGTANGEHILDYVTLIPEYRFSEGINSTTDSVKDLTCPTVDTVLGTWQGESLELSATMESPQIEHTHWQVKRLGDEYVLSENGVSQRFVPIDQFRWQAVDRPLQFWLLPGGVSCTVYPQLPRQQGARLEFCWYLSPQQRQRIVRDYRSNGDWIGTSLIVETRV